MFKKLDWKTVFKIVAGVLLIYLGIHYWPRISETLGTVISAATPILIGCCIAYPLDILLGFYERHFFLKSDKPTVIKARKAVSLIGAIITIIGIVALISMLIVPQLVVCVKMVVAEFPSAMDWVITKLKGNEFVSKDLVNALASIDWKSRITDIAGTLTSGIGNVMDVALSAVSSVFSVVFDVVLGLIFALYLLLDKKRLHRQIKRVSEHYVPNKFLDKIQHVLDILNDCFHRFIVGQCTEAVILGTLCTIGMLIFRIPYAPMIGALMAFTALIPIVGGLIGAGVGAFLILMESPVKALIFIIFVIVLQQIEGNLIYPKVVGSSIGLPALWVLAAVTIGGGVFGIFGMLVGVPVAATIYRLLSDEVYPEKNSSSPQDVAKQNKT